MNSSKKILAFCFAIIFAVVAASPNVIAAYSYYGGSATVNKTTLSLAEMQAKIISLQQQIAQLLEILRLRSVITCTPNAESGCKVCKADGSAWVDTNSKCSAGKRCQSGECIDNCSDKCSTGSKQCSGAGTQTCGNYNTDACLEWSTVAACATGQTCSEGKCVTPAVCTANEVSVCKVCNAAGTAWVDTDSKCATGQKCQAGVCVASATTSACNQALTADSKKIFVTSLTYSGNDLGSDAAADEKCQQAATAAGTTGTYKAMIYLGNRKPDAVLTAGKIFKNGQSVGSGQCQWNIVANSAVDFFSDKGGGSYLVNPIQYNEKGALVTNVNVWTNFKPIGGGKFDLLNENTFDPSIDGSTCAFKGYHYQPCISGSNYYSGATLMSKPYINACVDYHCQGCNSSGGCSIVCTSGVNWYGNTTSKTQSWAYARYANKVGDGVKNCNAKLRSLYCVEQ